MNYKQGDIVDIKISFEDFMKNTYTECTICGCTPKPDEWSAQVMGVCFDCGQYLVLSNYVFCYDWNYILVYLKEFAEDMSVMDG